jgi:hypothetical protein
MATFVVGFIVGASIAALAIIVIAPSRRVRAERALPQEDVTKLLLGEDPDEPSIPPEVPADDVQHPRAYDASELQALRSIGRDKGRRRR